MCEKKIVNDNTVLIRNPTKYYAKGYSFEFSTYEDALEYYRQKKLSDLSCFFFKPEIHNSIIKHYNLIKEIMEKC